MNAERRTTPRTSKTPCCFVLLAFALVAAESIGVAGGVLLAAPGVLILLVPGTGRCGRQHQAHEDDDDDARGDTGEQDLQRSHHIFLLFFVFESYRQRFIVFFFPVPSWHRRHHFLHFFRARQVDQSLLWGIEMLKEVSACERVKKKLYHIDIMTHR